ncbi:MAG TPA: hypothetical protein VNJ47_12125 [Nevskiales bacterium]|nr:hypothetical protein [Nevskiales bacterium]
MNDWLPVLVMTACAIGLVDGFFELLMRIKPTRETAMWARAICLFVGSVIVGVYFGLGPFLAVLLIGGAVMPVPGQRGG